MYKYLADIKQTFKYYINRKSFKYGVPIVIFSVMASVGLREFQVVRYKYRRSKMFRNEAEANEIELCDPSELSLERQYEKIKKFNIDDWENKRIPRPWED